MKYGCFMKNHFKETAALVGEPIRATILWTLIDGKSFTATELAIAADTSASNISMHLAKLVNADLLKVENHGRHRYYSFSRKEIAYAVETLAALIPQSSKKIRKQMIVLLRYSNAEPVMIISQEKQVLP